MAVFLCRDLEVELAVPRTNPAGLAERVAVLVNPIEDDVARTDGHGYIVSSRASLLQTRSPRAEQFAVLLEMFKVRVLEERVLQILACLSHVGHQVSCQPQGLRRVRPHTDRSNLHVLDERERR